MSQLNVRNLQGNSPDFRVTLDKDSTLSPQGSDIRFIAQKWQRIPVGNSKNFLAHKFYPLDLFTAYTGGGGTKGFEDGVRCTLSRETGGNSDSPVGGVALKMALSGNDAYTFSYNNGTDYIVTPARNGQQWTFSVYVKGDRSLSNCMIYIFEVDDSGNYTNFHTPTFGVTTSWQRVSRSATFSNGNTTGVCVRMNGPTGSSSGNLWWDGGQLELGLSVGDFVQGADTPKHDANSRETGSIQYNAQTTNLRLYHKDGFVDEAGTSNTGGAVGSFGNGGGFTVAEGARDTSHSAITGTENEILFEGLRYNDGTTGDETMSSTPNTRSFLEYVSSTSSNDFAFHTGHSSPGNVAWPQYLAVKVSAYPFGQVINRVRWYKHTNAIGNVNIWGSNQDINRTNFTETGTQWTYIARLHFGGQGSGGEGSQRSQSFTNVYGYRWYMLELMDINSSALSYPSYGTRGGWAMYPVTFDNT